MIKKRFLLIAYIMRNLTTVSAQQVIKLYEGKAAGSETWNWSETEKEKTATKSRAIYNISEPTLTAFLPKPNLATGTAIIIAPGGAFHYLAIDNEGIDVAKWLSSKGIAAFVLKYRLVKCETNDPRTEVNDKMQNHTTDFNASVAKLMPLAIADGKKAIEYVRNHAKEYDIAPNQIGLMGFSAGGGVTMGVTYNYTAENRPDFIAPIYAYVGEMVKNPVPTDAPPAFIAVALDDSFGFAPQNIELYKQWIAAKKWADLHIYQTGGHGFGMKRQKLPTDHWTENFSAWLKTNGWLKKLHPTPNEIKYGEDAGLEWQKLQDTLFRTDFGYLKRYADANKKLSPPKSDENRILFLGNSITEGWVNADPAFFNQSGKSYIGRGIGGQTSPQTLVRFRQDVIDLKPKVVIISIGTNDIAENSGPYNPNFTIGNIISMAELAKANGIKVILASVHPASEYVWRPEIKEVAQKIIALNEKIKDYAVKNKLVYLDYHTTLKNNIGGLNPDMAEDGVHPTLKAYKIMATLAEKAIETALKQK
jgi:lysophospholipase L1-like esterase/acetyl esterase/lipase